MQGYSMEGFCWVWLPSFSAFAKMPWVQFRRGGDASLPPRSPHTGGTGIPGQLLHRDWRSSGLLWFSGAVTALRHLSPTGADTRSTKAHDQGPFSMSTTTPEGHWLMVGANAESFHSSHQKTCTMHGLLIPSVVSLTMHGSDIIISNCRSHES